MRQMLDAPKRWWRSVTRRGGDHTDPKEQLALAIADADHQHRRLKEQATNVIANQKQAEIRLNTKLG
jgi:phage shock protein A